MNSQRFINHNFSAHSEKTKNGKMRVVLFSCQGLSTLSDWFAELNPCFSLKIVSMTTITI